MSRSKASWSRITIYWDCTSRLAGQHFGFKSAYWFSDNLHATSNWAGTRDEPLRTSAGEGDKIFFSPKYTIKIFKYVFFFVTAKIPGAVDNVTGRQGDRWEEYYFLVSPYVFSFLRERGGGGWGAVGLSLTWYPPAIVLLNSDYLISSLLLKSISRMLFRSQLTWFIICVISL